VLSWRLIALSTPAYALCVLLAGMHVEAGNSAGAAVAAAGRWGVGLIYLAGAAHLARSRAEWLAALIANGPAALGAGLAAGIIGLLLLGGAVNAAPLRTLGGLAVPIVLAGILAPAIGALVSARVRAAGDPGSAS
jgi:hypothetical protein